MQDNTKKNYIWNSVGIFLNAFLSLFFSTIISRVNGFEYVGGFYFAFTIALIAYNVGIYGGRVYQVSDIKGEFSENVYLSVKYSASFIVFVGVLGFIMLNQYDEVKIITILIWVVIKLSEAVSDGIYGVFQRNHRLDYVGKSFTIKAVLSVIIFIMIDVMTQNILFSSLAVLCIHLLVLFSYDVYYLKKFMHPKFLFNLEVLKAFKQAAYLFLFGLITVLIIQIPRFFVDAFLSNYEQSYFTFIFMVPTAMGLIAQFVIQPELVRLSNIFYAKKHQQFIKLLMRILIIIGVLGFLATGMAYLLGPWVLGIVGGVSFSDYRFIITLVVLGATFNAISTVLSNALTVMRDTKGQFIIYLFVFIINIILSYFSVKYYSLNGILTAYLLTMIIQCILFVVYFIRNFKLKREEN